jgi:TM2 domain-containing membrane protein YozV
MIPDNQNEMEDIKSHKDKVNKINTLLDKLDERLACGEITESRYKELHDRYKAEVEKLKDHLTEQELMHEVGLEPEDKEVEYQETEPEKAVFYENNTKYCSNCRAVIDEKAEICPKCGVRVLFPQVYHQKKSGALAAILSAVIPGGGQIYCGRGIRGVGFFVLNLFMFLIFAAAATINPNSDGQGILLLILIMIWLWNIFDANKIAHKTNQM